MPWINVKLIEIEGLAMNGLIGRVEVVECEKPRGWRRIVATTRDGQTLASECLEPDAARRNFMVLTLYSKRWGNLIFTGEEVTPSKQEE